MRLTTLFVIFLISASTLFGQRYAFISFSTPEGLPQSQVNSITQDDAGYLWVGTFEGLARFNGKDFVSFNKSNGLLSNRIYTLNIVNERLYVGHDNGISFQVSKDSFASIPYPEEASRVSVTGFLQYNNHLYIATNGAGLYMLDENQGVLNHVQNSPERIRGIALSNNELFLATREGVYTFNQSNEFNRLEAFNVQSYSSIHAHKKGVVATSFEGYLMTYDAVNDSVEIIYESAIHRFRNVLVTPSGDLWLNSMNGVVKIGKKQVIELSEESGLPIDDVSSIFKDREGNVWLGTGGKGLLKFSGETFTHFDRKNGLASDIVISCIQDHDSVYWVSSFDKGAFKMWFKGAEKKLMIEDAPELAYRVWSSAKNESNLFFGSVAGLYVFDGKKWRLHTTDHGLPAEKITGIYAAQDGEVWVGTTAGVAIYNQGAFRLLLPEEARLINVRDFIVREDTVYLAAQRGFYRIDKSENLVIIQDFDGGVNTVEEDEFGRIWIGSENGLYLYANDTVTSFPLRGNIGTEYINFLARHHHTIFVGTNAGLYAIDTRIDNVTHYGINAGLVDLETNLNSAFIDYNNNLWFGTVAGLMRMDLKELTSEEKSITPKLHLKDIKVNFASVGLSTFENYDLTYKRNNISFSFDGLYLTNPNALTYTYRLIGFSQEFSPPSTNNVVTFTNLPHGNFTLEVKALINDRLESEPFIITFVITPPFYRTWWFYALGFALVLFVLLAIDRYRVRSIQNKNYQEKLEFRNKLVQLEQQSLNASMNRHFIFNSLNAIQYYINSSDKLSANRFLNRFAKLIRKNLDTSNQKNGLVSLQDELERLELYVQLENMRFNGRFTYAIEVDELVETDALHVPAMFLQPFVENSIIHGVLPLKDRVGEVKVAVTDHLDHIRIEITDNGIGIDQSRDVKKDAPGDHKSQGMLITKGRIELLQKFSAKSIIMIGPRQISESDGLVKGTQVIFKILKVYLED